MPHATLLYYRNDNVVRVLKGIKASVYEEQKSAHHTSLSNILVGPSRLTIQTVSMHKPAKGNKLHKTQYATRASYIPKLGEKNVDVDVAKGCHYTSFL